jgi:AraC-like DNA-binding protein
MFELLIRGLAIGTLLAAGLSMLRGGPLNAPRLAGALFCLATCGFVAHTSATIPGLIGPIRDVAWLLSAGGTSYFWLFGVALFSDGSMKPFHAAPVIFMTGLAAFGNLLPPYANDWSDIVHNIFEVVLVAHVLTLIWRARPDDLVTDRFALRGPFIASVGVFCVILSGFDIAWSLGFRDPWVKEFQALALTVMALSGVYALTQGAPNLFDRAKVDAQADAEPLPGPGSSFEDAETRAKFAPLLADDAYWRIEGLTLAKAAAQAGVQEYRLRRHINQEMGYRNFPDFLNARRIEMAKKDLSSPSNAQTQISTIAFALGYSSLGPFNRAFRAATGVAPSEWRKKNADS